MTRGSSVGLEMIARQQHQILDEIQGLRDSMRVLTAIIMRIDRTASYLLQELREQRIEFDRLTD